MSKLRFILTILSLIMLVAASDYSEAATPITLKVSSDATSYSIKATELPEASGVDLSITYDAAALKDPKVTSGALVAGAIMVPNTETPGFVRIVIVTGGVIKGTGELVSITFTKKENTPAKQPTLSSNAYSVTGSQIAVQSVSETPQPLSESKVEGDTTKISTTAGTTAGTVYSGTISLPDPIQQQEQKVKSVKQENPDDSQPAPSQHESPATAAESSEAASAAIINESSKKTASLPSSLHSIKGVLTRFSEYRGPRTLKGFAAIFDKNEAKTAGIVQTPAIVVSDGKTLLTVELDLSNDAAPSFSLKGANMKSIRRISDKIWELDAMPQKGKSDVRLSILLKGESTEIPLVVVPPLNQAAVAKLNTLTVVTLDTMLATPLKNNKPLYDLNSDGKQDYVDDYILVAHWLLKQQQRVNGAGRKPSAAGK